MAQVSRPSLSPREMKSTRARNDVALVEKKGEDKLR
jgi:hypothetical protein